MNYKLMGERLKGLREMHGLNMADLIRITSYNRNTLEKYESGEGIKYASLNIVADLADFYGVSLDYILGRCELDEKYELKIEELYEKSYEKYLRINKRTEGDLSSIILKSKGWSVASPGYPYSLIDAINKGLEETNTGPIEVPLSDFQKEELEKIIDNELTKREADCIRLYFKDELTLDQTGKKFGVTMERIRQILARALRKLRHPARVKLIKYGYEDAIKLKEDYKKAMEVRAKLIADISEANRKNETLRETGELDPEEAVEVKSKEINLMEMDLSVRSFNCLARALRSKGGCKDIFVDDVKDLVMSGKICEVRNLGRRSTEEIIGKLTDLGALEAEEQTKLMELYPFAYA